MSTVADHLRTEIETWGHIGHPALLQRFILGTGQPWAAQALPKRYPQGVQRECFAQAIALAKKHRRTLRYVEGFGLSAGLRGFPLPVHHAWCADAAGRVVDPTWRDPAASLYFGRAFTLAEWERETDITGSMSALGGDWLNAEFMFRILPGLEAACEAVKKDRLRHG